MTTYTEHHFRLMLDQCPEIVWMTDEAHSAIFLNDAWCKYTGLPLSAGMGYGWKKLIHPEDLQRIEEEWQKSAGKAIPFESEQRLMAANGQYRHFIVRALPFKEGQGQSTSWIGTCTDIEDQKEYYAREKENFRIILESIPVAAWTCNAEGNCDYVNRRWLEMVNATPEQVIGYGWLNFIHPEDREPTLKAWSEYVQTGKPLEFTQRVGNPEGEYRWYLTRAIGMHAPGGRLLRFVGGSTDIDSTIRSSKCLTAINQVFEQALACETEEQLGDACLAVAQWLTDSNLGFIGEVNSKGLHDAIAMSPGIRDLMDGCKIQIGSVRPYFKDFPLRGIDRCVEKEGKSRFINGEEAIKAHPDFVGFPEGHAKITSFLGVPLKEADTTIGIIALANKVGGYDSTDVQNAERLAVAFVQCLRRKRAESEGRAARCLKAINQVFQEALVCETVEQLGQVCITAAQSLTNSKFGFIGSINAEGLHETFAHTADSSFMDGCKMPAEQAAPLLKSMPIRGVDRTVEREGKSRIVNGEDAIKSHPDYVGFPEGHARLSTFLGVPLKEAGKTIGMIGLANKSGGYTLADQENVEALSGSIVQALSRKKAEIEGKQADQSARDLAIAASNMKTEFLAHISHELRTPLAGILGMNELLLQLDLPDQAKEFGSAVEFSAKAMLDLVNDLLDISRIEAGKVVLENAPFNPLELIDKAVEVSNTAARNKNISLTNTIDASIPHRLLGDAGRIQQILLNLLSNAIKFTPRGEVSIKTSIESRQRNRILLKFSISDTGIGIAEEDQKFLFQPFSQVARSRKRGQGGTGLGLVISKRLVELMGGKIGFSSEKDRGSTFWCLIPFEVAGNYTHSRISKSVRTEAANASLAAHALVIEDDPVARRMLQKQLENLGLSCDVVETAEQGIANLEENSYSIIFMDYHLPEMDGLEAARLIRQKEAGVRHTPIVALTASAMTGDHEKCLSAGMDAYISKPYTLAQLQETLSLWLSAFQKQQP